MDLTVTWTGAFLAGLVSFASPCVLPLVPPYLCFLAGVSLDELTGDDPDAGTGSHVVYASIAFVTGFALVFVSFGASASLIGAFVVDHLTELGYVAGIIIVLLGLHFLGVFRIGLLYREARFSRHELTDSHRAHAMRSLDAVLAALDAPGQVIA